MPKIAKPIRIFNSVTLTNSPPSIKVVVDKASPRNQPLPPQPYSTRQGDSIVPSCLKENITIIIRNYSVGEKNAGLDRFLRPKGIFVNYSESLSMNSQILRSYFFAITLYLGSSLALAHHGDAGRYEETTIVITGKVVALQLINPHSTVIFDVADETGAMVRWQGEFTSPRTLATRFGWTKNTVKPGDEVIFTGRQVKGGGPIINLSERARIVLANTCEEIYVTNSDPEHPISCGD